MIAMEEVGRKASAEMEVVRTEVVEVLGARGTGWTQVWVWTKGRVRTYWMKMVRACLGPNVSKMMRGLVVATDALVADVVALDMALWMNTADNPFPWTWALDRVATDSEAAGSGRGIDIGSLGSMTAAAEDEGMARREHCAPAGHWEGVLLAAPVVRWVGESSWSCAPEHRRL